MKDELPNTKLTTNTADGISLQSTIGAGGCKIQCETDRPCYVHIAQLQENSKAYLQSKGGLDG